MFDVNQQKVSVCTYGNYFKFIFSLAIFTCLPIMVNAQVDKSGTTTVAGGGSSNDNSGAGGDSEPNSDPLTGVDLGGGSANHVVGGGGSSNDNSGGTGGGTSGGSGGGTTGGTGGTTGGIQAATYLVTNHKGDHEGNHYYAGFFSGTLEYRNFEVTARGGEDLFILKLNAFGEAEWLIRLGGKGDDRAERLLIDEEGNIFLAGLFSETIHINQEIEMKARGHRDILTLCLNAQGTILWARSAGGSGDDQIKEFIFDPWGDPLVMADTVHWTDFGSEVPANRLIQSFELTYSAENGEINSLNIAEKH